MNSLLQKLKIELTSAMKTEVDIRKNPSIWDSRLSVQLRHLEEAVAYKTVSRSIISMIPQLGKKPKDTTIEDIQKLLKKYIKMEKERRLYELHYLKKEDVEGKSASEVKKLVNNKIQELGDNLTSNLIEIAQSYLPKEVSEEEVHEFIATIDMSKFKNKMQAMGLIMKQFPGIDGNFAKRILMNS